MKVNFDTCVALLADTSLRLQAAQLLVALFSACHPTLLQQLMDADVVEYLCECVRRCA